MHMCSVQPRVGFTVLFDPASVNLIVRNTFAQLYAVFDTLPLFLLYTLGTATSIQTNVLIITCSLCMAQDK